MTQAMPIGIDDFKEIISQNYYFVDKTDFIRQLIDKHSKVTLNTRPRRFGKTLTLSMLDYFFSIKKAAQSEELFTGLSIAHTDSHYMQHRGKSPVIFITLKDFSVRTWADMLDMWQDFLQNLFLKYTYLLDTSRVQPELIRNFQSIVDKKANVSTMSTAIALLMQIMHQYYGKEVILLIDEYDAPIQQAWNEGFYEDCIVFMRQLLSSALKSNSDLDFAVLTGVLRISKESIFSGLNNIKVCSVADPVYESVMGFTQAEVTKMARDMQMEQCLPELKYWYDGYHFGKTDIYNPWSIINFFDRQRTGNYWVNTSSNSIIHHMLQHLNEEKEETLLDLLHGQSIIAAIREGVIYDDINRDEDTLYTLLLTTGYLTIVDRQYGISGLTCELAIPNREVQDVFRIEIQG